MDIKILQEKMNSLYDVMSTASELDMVEIPTVRVQLFRAIEVENLSYERQLRDQLKELMKKRQKIKIAAEEYKKLKAEYDRMMDPLSPDFAGPEVDDASRC